MTSQALQMLEALRKESVSTIKAREHYGILHPADAVHHLRGEGHLIRTDRAAEDDHSGHTHKVAIYTLLAEVK